MSKNRITINEKTISRKESLKIANEIGKLHKAYSEILTEEINGTVSNLNQVYELPDGDYLYISNVNGKHGGKGNIYSKHNFDKFILKVKRINEDMKHGRTSNIAHWIYYSKYKFELVDHIPDLKLRLSVFLEIENSILDYSTKSLDIISKHLKEKNLDDIFEEYYDNLVAYIGETIIKNSKMETNWSTEPFFKFPVITSDENNVFFNPINVIWEELTNFEELNLRIAYGKELRRIGSLVSFQKKIKI